MTKLTPEEIGILIEELQDRQDYHDMQANEAESRDYPAHYHVRRIDILDRAMTLVSGLRENPTND